MLRRFALIVIALSLLPVAIALAVPTKDSFAGAITAATGKYTGTTGKVHVDLNPSSSSSQVRKLRLRLTGRLHGRLVGTMSRQSSLPDTGVRYTIHASGKIKPLGHVVVTGVVTGTGFILHGHERLRLQLSNSRGSVSLTGASRLVPGFTSP